VVLGLLLTVLPQPGILAQFPLEAEEGDHEFRVQNVFIEARDGVQLHARIWMPTNVEGPIPSILTLTPYTSDDGHRFGVFYASHGFAYVNADIRGRGESSGEAWPLERDGLDGADIVGWIVTQPWSDGEVGMRGGSYRGMTQWQTLKEFPEGLVTIVPTASVHPGWDYPNPSGIFLSYAAQWLGFVEGEASQANLFGDSDYWHGKFLELYARHGAFSELDDLTGISPRVFERWIAHPGYDEFWKAMNPAPEDYARTAIPILTITGHFDGDQPGALKYYRDHMTHGPEGGKEDHYLIIGPWSHGGTRIPQAELGGLTFGPNSVLNMEAVHLAWFDWTLRDGPKPAFLEDRVAHYVMKADEWRFAPSLGEVASGQREWFLTSDGPVYDVFSSGTLSPEVPSTPGVDEFTYDPLTTIDDEIWRESPWAGSYVSGGQAFHPGPKVVYHSPPLSSSATVAGYALLELFIELDVPDTDLLASLYEIRSDGQTIYLGQSELRARHRNGVDRSELVTPGSVERYPFDRFYWFSRELKAGSRIRVVVAPFNTPHRDKNYNSGGNTIEETGADARTATIRIHHGPEHPSRLILPVGGG
jgi:putative CocE/NonD family hydrolase